MSDDPIEYLDELEGPDSALDLARVALQLLDGDVDENAVAKIGARRSFVEHIARGFGAYHAGLAVGWSEAQIRQALADPEMTEIINVIDEYKNDSVETSIWRSAVAGNVQAQKMWALAKMPERGWVEKRTHVIEGQARVDVVHSVKEALRDTLREEGAIAGLHAAYIDTDVVGDA